MTELKTEQTASTRREASDLNGLVMTDTKRLDFLESLLLRKAKLTKKEFWLDTDIHIDRGRCVIYARTGIGSNIEFDGVGDSVREAIDDAIENAAKS